MTTVGAATFGIAISATTPSVAPKAKKVAPTRAIEDAVGAVVGKGLAGPPRRIPCLPGTHALSIGRQGVSLRICRPTSAGYQPESVRATAARASATHASCCAGSRPNRRHPILKVAPARSTWAVAPIEQLLGAPPASLVDEARGLACRRAFPATIPASLRASAASSSASPRAEPISQHTTATPSSRPRSVPRRSGSATTPSAPTASIAVATRVGAARAAHGVAVGQSAAARLAPRQPQPTIRTRATASAVPGARIAQRPRAAVALGLLARASARRRPPPRARCPR